MLKRIIAHCLAFMIAALPLTFMNILAVSADSPEGRWELIDTVDYVNESQTYSDGAALLYSMSDNSITHTNRNNAKQEFAGTCSWSQPSSSISSGEQITVNLSASLDKLEPKRVGTFSATVNAYLDAVDISYKLKSGSAIDLKDVSGETLCKALGKDGQIVTSSASLTVSATMPDGGDGKQVALMVSTNIGGGKKFIYRYAAYDPVAMVTVQPPTTEENPEEQTESAKKLVLTGTVRSVASNPLRNMYISFTPSFKPVTESKTDHDGKFRFETDIPADTTSPITVALSLSLKYMRPDSDGMSDVYFAIRDQAQKPDEEVNVTTTITIDPDAAEWKDKDVIEINRNIDYVNITRGYISGVNGIQDPIISNLRNHSMISGYTYVYDQLSSAIYTALEVFHQKEATIGVFPIIVYVNMPGGKDAYFTVERSVPTIHMSSHYSAFNDDTRFAILHEFGHYFDYATNSLSHRCGWESKMLDIDYINHGGYLNTDTGDSFIEGFATWYAAMVQKHGLYPITNYASIAELGSLGTKRKPWNSDISEELCISSILTYLERDMTLDTLWSVLKNDRDNFNAYYQDLLQTDYAKNNLNKFNRYFRAFGIYKQIYGNRQHDDWELYRVVIDDDLREEYEPFADLMFDRFGVLNSHVNPQDVLKTLGQSSDFIHNRDALPTSAGTILLLPNSFLKVTGLSIPGDVRVAVIPEGEDGYAYVGTPEDNLVYLPLPEEASAGMVEVTIPGGGVLWSGDLRELQETFFKTRGVTAWLAEVKLTEEQLPGTPVLTCPVNGDVSADPILSLDEGISNDVPVFATIGAETATGRPIQAFSEGEFVINEIGESPDDALTGGYAPFIEESDKKGNLTVFLFVIMAVITVLIAIFILIIRKKHS